MKRPMFSILPIASWVLLTVVVAACGSANGGDADSGLVDGSVTSPGLSPEFVFDESEVRQFHIRLPDADWEALQVNARDEQYVAASLEYEGETVDNIGLRFKGSYGSLVFCFSGNTLICDKLSLKLKFNEYVPGQRFAGLKRINLHAMDTDPSKMHDAIAYKLYRDQGVYAPRVAYARVVVNGVSLGLYAVVEAVDGRFTRSRFPDGGEGNLYKEVWPMHLVEQPYLGALKTNEDSAPSADKMLRFAQELDGAGDAGFVAVLQRWMDVDMLMKYMAVDRLIDHWDGIVAWYCAGGPCTNHNFYWYESSTEDKVWLVPWDMDHTFEEPSPVRSQFGMPDWDEVDGECTPITIFFGITGRPPACDLFIGRMARLLWPEYAAATNELLGGAFSQENMESRVDSLAELIEAEIAADTKSTQTIEEWRVEVETLKTAIATKRAYIEAKLQ